MYKNILYSFLFTITIIFFSFLYIINKNVPKNFFKIALSVDKKYLFLSIFLAFLFYTFDNLRTFIISRSIGVKYSFLYGYVIALINSFGATVTPFYVGGELLPFYTLKRVNGQIYQIMSIITLKGFSGIFFYIIFLPFTIHSILTNPHKAKEIISLFLLILFITVILFTLWQLIFKKGLKFLSKETLRTIKYTLFKYFVICKVFLKEKKKVFLVILMCSLFMYSSLLFTGIFLVKTFNESASIREVFLAQLPLIYAIFMSPTPGGSGIGEIGALSVFDTFISADSIGVFVILWRIISQYLGAFIGGVLFFILIFKDIRTKND
ncbi:MAG: flippase-like domain-containing protein [Thermodesulfobacterium sp.]|nr:flippase-like domain-containing protein [Thermodesulfobacterium sp.]